MQLNRGALDALLAQAPDERLTNRAAAPPVIMTLPLPDGRFSRFQIEESPILEPGLVAAFPAIKTYRGAGLDDPTATARVDVTLNGFHAMVIAAGGTVYVDPYTAGDFVNHVAYDKATLRPRDLPFFEQLPPDAQGAQERTYNTFPITNGTSLRTYRLALSATAEYVAAAGGTQALALSRMTTTMNRVNGIYERELAVRMTVSTGPAGNVLQLISTNATDYLNNDGGAMLAQNQTRTDTIMTAGAYDIGHVFSTGGGGIAALGSVCSAGNKALGVTGSPSPVGDAFDVDYVAHEMGHQFGGSHTFNGTTSNCGGGTRSAAHAYEVGSGSTIQAYAGICGLEDLQLHSDPIFNFESLNEMTAFISSGGGFSCGTASATGNTVPAVSGPGATFTIPRLTPFALTATGSDANGDTVTYLWEEHDLGTSSTSGTVGTDDGSRPLFRSYSPSTTPTRLFPSLTYILNSANTPPLNYTCGGGTCTTGEVLPSTSRTMNFMVTARDNRAGGGGINTALTQVTVNAALGPFAVTAPNTAVSWTGTTSQTVTWSETGTSALAPTVRILLSTDGGATFPTVLLNGVPNDGSDTVTVPNTPTTTARIKVEAVGNIFFDISNTNFTIVAGGPPPGAPAKSAPANGATGMSQGPTLAWGTSGGATSYEYCVDKSANAACDTSWVSSGTGTSTALSDLSPNTTYSWQVRAVNGIGSTEADGGTWWTFSTAAATAAQADVAVDFGNAGLWGYYDVGTGPTWQMLHHLSPSRMARGDLDGNGRTDLILVFPGYGTWAFMNNTTYVQLHFLDAGLADTGDMDGNGRDEVVMTFAGYGTWARYDDGTWRQLHPYAASVLAVGNINGSAGGRADVVVTFAGAAGIWAYSNNAAWEQVHFISAADLKIGDVDGNGIGDLVVQFTQNYGEYILFNRSTWYFLSPTVATGIVLGNIDGDAGGRADVVINLPGQGLMAFLNAGSWVQLHFLTAAAMAAGDIDGNGTDDLVVSFTPYGLWTRRNGPNWAQIHVLNPEAFVTGRMNAN